MTREEVGERIERFSKKWYEHGGDLVASLYVLFHTAQALDMWAFGNYEGAAARLDVAEVNLERWVEFGKDARVHPANEITPQDPERGR